MTGSWHSTLEDYKPEEENYMAINGAIFRVRDHLRRWVLLFAGLVPVAQAQGCCPLGYIFCNSIGWPGCPDYWSSAMMSYYGTNPVSGGGLYENACVWCSAGCPWCGNMFVAVATDCCGSVGSFSGYLCCRFEYCCG